MMIRPADAAESSRRSDPFRLTFRTRHGLERENLAASITINSNFKKEETP